MDRTRRSAAEAGQIADRIAMLWQQYIFRRGDELLQLWDGLFQERSIRLLYMTGRGFDLRAQKVMQLFIDSGASAARGIDSAKLLMIEFPGYELSDDLRKLTEENATELARMFSKVGQSETLSIGFSAGGEDDISPSNALRIGAEDILNKIDGYTDIVLDVSTLPRVLYVTLITGLLERLIPDKRAADALFSRGVNLHMLVAEDPVLDALIQPQDPSNDLILIPGFAAALHTESVRDWPLVWFPILGEGRVSQFDKVMNSAIPTSAEICPILPHPSRKLRRADQLLMEYKTPLFDTRQTPTSNILYVHEAHPFEAYRQLLGVMKRYRNSMNVLGGCRLVVTPLGSKLITLGASLACYEMRPSAMVDYGVAIPYAEPKRYIASRDDIARSMPEICGLLVTGEAYAEPLLVSGTKS
jgi:hypothetical protein